MALIIKHILQSDSMSDFTEKVNYNFNQVLLNGGGPQGVQGVIGPQGLIGTAGTRGSIWFEGVGDPNLQSFSIDLNSQDQYLENNGDIWEYSAISLLWTNTGINIQGPQGDPGINDWTKGGTYGPHPYYDGYDFMYVPGSADLYTATGTNDIVSILIGGYPPGGVVEHDPIGYAPSIQSTTGVLFLHTHGTGKQLIFSHKTGTNDVDFMPYIRTSADDLLTILNPRNANTAVYSPIGISLTSSDTGIGLYSGRDFEIRTTGTPDTSSQGSLSTSIGNISIVSNDSDGTYGSPNQLLIQNTLLSGGDRYAKILMTSDTKGSNKYMLLEVADNTAGETSSISIEEPATRDMIFKTMGNFEFNTQNTWMLYNTYGSIGIGAAGTDVSTWLGYYGGVTNQTNNKTIHIKDIVNPDPEIVDAYEFGLWIDKTFLDTNVNTPQNPSTTYRGGAFYQLSAQNSGNDQYFHLTGSRTEISLDSTNKMDSARGHSVYVTKIGANTDASLLENLMCFDSKIDIVGGHVTNSYHLYMYPTIETSPGTIDNKFGIFQAGTTELNYFGGKILIGVNAEENETLNVYGRIEITDDPGLSDPTRGGVIRYNENNADFEGFRDGAWYTMTGKNVNYVIVDNPSPALENRITTTTNDAGIIDAEENLTFDGITNILTVTGDISVSNDVVITGALQVDTAMYSNTVTGKTGFGTATPAEVVEINGSLSFTAGVNPIEIAVNDSLATITGLNLSLIAGSTTSSATHTHGGNLILDGGKGHDQTSTNGDILIGTWAASTIYLHNSNASDYNYVCINTITKNCDLNIDNSIWMNPISSNVPLSKPPSVNGAMYIRKDSSTQYETLMIYARGSGGTGWYEVNMTFFES